VSRRFTGFTEAELAYLTEEGVGRLGRLATVDADGAPQNSPVGYRVDTATGAVTIGGWDLANTRKFRNVAANPHVALVVDDVASVSPWRVRGIELRGTAEALTDVDPPIPGTSRAVIRIHPTRIITWGLD
jgi:pyridoxamine 5'-phosphate oxidase family protein